MEFKFRSIHYYNSTPPNSSYYTHQSFRGMMNPEMGHRELPWHPPPNPYEFHEAMQYQRELEKEKIRAEIIAEEIVRRRILEEEVRRELMMEREMGVNHMMRFNGGYAPQPLLSNFEHNRERLSNGGGVGFRRIETMPFQRDPVVASGVGNGLNGNRTPVALDGNVQENKGVFASEVVKDSKLIILPKSTVTAADLKRKAVMEPDGPTAAELISSGSKKQKTKDDWSCALCRVSATSERGLNEHLQGKKHKARERGLLTQKTGFGTPLLKKKITPTKGNHITTPKVESCPTSKNNDEKMRAAIDNSSAQKKESSVEKKENGQVQVQPIKLVVTSGTATPKEKSEDGQVKVQPTKPVEMSVTATPEKSENGQVQVQPIKPVVMLVTAMPKEKSENVQVQPSKPVVMSVTTMPKEKSEGGEVQVQPVKPVVMSVTATPKEKSENGQVQALPVKPGVISVTAMPKEKSKGGEVQVQPTKPLVISVTAMPKEKSEDGQVLVQAIKPVVMPVTAVPKEKSEDGQVQVQPIKPVVMPVTATPKEKSEGEQVQVQLIKPGVLSVTATPKEKSEDGQFQVQPIKPVVMSVTATPKEKSENGQVQVQPIIPVLMSVTATPKNAILTKPEQVKTPGPQSFPRLRKKNKKAGGGTGNNVTAIATPKKYQFWCEVCKVGTHLERTMNEHKGGRKHLMKLRKHLIKLSKVNQTGETETTTPGKFFAPNVWKRKEETGRKQVEIKAKEIEEASVWYAWKLNKEANNNNNLSTTDDKDKDNKKPSETVCSGVIADGENKQLGAGNVADS